MDEELKTKFFKILDEYYTLKRPNELGVEPENKLMALIASYSREAGIDELTEALQMNGAHPGDWEVAIHQRIAELKALGGKPEGKPNE